MTELVTSGSVGGMASNGRLYPDRGIHVLASHDKRNLWPFIHLCYSSAKVAHSCT